MLASHAALARCQAALEVWRKELGATVSHDSINRSCFELQTNFSAVSVEDLIVLAEDGCDLQLSLSTPSVTIRAHTLPAGDYLLETSDDLTLGFEPNDASELEAALETHDLRAVADLANTASLEITAWVKVDPEVCRFHWVRTTAALIEGFKTDNWISSMHRLFSAGSPADLIVSDGGTRAIATPSLLIRGPEASILPLQDPWNPGSRDYANAILADRPMSLPPMSALYPIRTSKWEDLAEHIHRVATCLGWWWLADSVTLIASDVELRFSGARIATARLGQIEHFPVPADLYALWSWATEGADHDRRYAVQQAASLAVYTVADLATAPAPMLRTAKSIHELARRGAVAEAMATRRTIRVGAVEAATRASEAARTAGVKALERTVVQVGVVAGIVIANTKDALNTSAAAKLLAVAGGVALVITMFAVLVEHRSAATGFSAFRKDLQKYTDTLSREDIDDVLSMDSLRSARKTIATSLMGIVLVGAAFQVGVWLTLDHVTGHRWNMVCC